MRDALHKVEEICLWHLRFGAAQVGCHLSRTTADVRDKWKKATEKWGQASWIFWIYKLNYANRQAGAIGTTGYADCRIEWGKKEPSSAGGGIGCNDTEYQRPF